jgi:hypothetical protein
MVLFAYGFIQLIECGLSGRLDFWWEIDIYEEYRWKSGQHFVVYNLSGGTPTQVNKTLILP